MKAKLDKKNYEKGKKVSDNDMEKLNIKHDKIHPQWNYAIKPRKKTNDKK